MADDSGRITFDDDAIRELGKACPTPVLGINGGPDPIQVRAIRTWKSTGNHALDMLKAAAGLACESAELFNLFNRAVFKGKALDRATVLDEAGDVLYYLAILLAQFGVTIDELSLMNREKLKDGKHGWPENAK